MQLSVTDLGSLSTSAVVLASYHVFLWLKSRSDPTYTVQKVNARVRTKWVEAVMQDNKDILAVQTLRNSTMAATFLASTAVILVMGILSLVGRGDALLSPSGPKLLLMLVDLFVAFFAFTMSIRLYSHVGYMISTPGTASAVSPAIVARHLNRGANFYSAGMRAFYFLVPLVAWLFGPWALGAATLGLLVLLFVNDRAPADS